MRVAPAPRPWRTFRSLLRVLLCLCPLIAAQAQGPIAYYPFSGNASDQSGNGHHGVVTGAALIADRFGRARSAYLFDGNDFITVAHSQDLTFRSDQEFTIAAWVQACRSQDDFAGIVAKGPSNVLRPGYQLMVSKDSLLALDISRNNGDLERIIGTRSIIGPRWHFVTVVVSPPLGTVRMYIDGVLDIAADSLGLEPNLRDDGPPLFIGKERNSSLFFRGAIDDVRIYDRALGKAEITELYRENGWEEASGSTGIVKIATCPGTPVTLGIPELLPPFVWSTGDTSRSITVAGPGRYLLEGTVASGCRRTDTFVVTVGAGIRVDAGSRVRICRDSSVRLAGTVEDPDGSHTYEWFPADGLGSSSSATTTASPRQTTTYYLRVTGAGGCTGIDSVTVVVDVLPAGAAGDDVRICAGEQVQIGRPPATGSSFSYRWISGEGLSSPLVARPLARPTATGAYVLETRSAAGCSVLDTVIVTVTDPPRLDVGPDMRTCSGASVRIGSNATGGSGSYSYSWSPGIGLSSTSEAMPLATPATTTRYIVRATDANGCSVADTVTVLVEELPAGGAGADIAVCAGMEVRIGATPPAGPSYTYRWISGEGLLSTDTPRPLVRPTASGRYVVETRNDAGCTTLDTMLLTVHPTPHVEAGADLRLCAGSTVGIGSSASGGAAPYRYSWSPAAGLSSTSEAAPLARPTASTRYHVTVTDANGCSTTDSVLVEVDILPSGGAGADMAICPGDEAVIGSTTAPVADYSYEWISGEGLLSTDIPRPRVRPTSTGEYVLRIRNSAGCEILDTTVVEVYAPPRVDAGPDRQLCSDDAVRIGSEATGGMGPYVYAWSPATGLSSTTEAIPLAAPAVPTRYSVIVTDARGCRDTSTVMVAPGLPEVVAVDVKQSGELVLDPEFSPGADGMICDSVRIRNLGDLPFESSSITLAASSWFSISPDQIPFVIPPHSERALALCYQPLTAVDRLDTLRLGEACGVAIPLVLRTNLSVDDCGIPLAIHLVGKRTHVRTEPPYPNPAGDRVALNIERASPTLEPLPAGACGLYSNLGVEVATASYMPERGWSLDGMSYERGSFTFATDQLPAGIYHVRIRLGEAVTSYPVVIAR